MLSTRRQQYSLWFAVCALVFLLATNLVYIRLAFEAPPHERYTGMGLEAVSDKLVYYAMIEQGRAGKLFMHNPHTSEPQHDSLFSPQWFAIGQTVHIFGISIEVAYHIARVVLTLLFLMVLIRMVRRMFAVPLEQLLALSAVLFSSGLGWLYYVAHPEIADASISWLLRLQMLPVDLYVTELSPVTAFVQSPLFMLSYLLLISIWYVVVEGGKNRTWRTDTVLFVLSLILVLIHPYDAAVLFLTSSGYAVAVLWRSRDWLSVRRAAAIIAGVVVAIAYHATVLIREPAVAGWLSQNLAFSPPLGAYVWGLGMLSPLWIIGMYAMIRRRETRSWWLLMLAWSLAVAVSIYVPFGVNRRFANAWLIPIAFMASYGLLYVLRAIRPYVVRAAFGMLVALCAFSGTVYHLAQAAFYEPTGADRYAYYLNRSLQDAIAYTSSHASYPSVLLSNEEFIAMLFGAYSTSVLYLGHPDQTVRYPLKKQQIEWLFGPTEGENAAERKRAFLRDAHIGYMLVYKPSLAHEIDWLGTTAEIVYENQSIRLYRIMNE